jgi:hypothetical protein
MFFIRVLPVTPSRFRPPSKVAGRLFENAQNVHYKKVMDLDIKINELQAARKKMDAIAAGLIPAPPSPTPAKSKDAKEAKSADSKKKKGEKTEKIEAEKTAAQLNEEMVRVWIEMQNEVNLLIDSSKK